MAEELAVAGVVEQDNPGVSLARGDAEEEVCVDVEDVELIERLVARRSHEAAYAKDPAVFEAVAVRRSEAYIPEPSGKGLAGVGQYGSGVDQLRPEAAREGDLILFGLPDRKSELEALFEGAELGGLVIDRPLDRKTSAVAEVRDIAADGEGEEHRHVALRIGARRRRRKEADGADDQ